MMVMAVVLVPVSDREGAVMNYVLIIGKDIASVPYHLLLRLRF
jgi:hypothetical protein